MDSAETPLADPYDASAITILDAEEAARRFGFVQAADLAVRYPSVSSEFIVRLIEACRLIQFPLPVAVRRYLDRDKAAEAEVPATLWETLRECHLELMRQRHRPR